MAVSDDLSRLSIRAKEAEDRAAAAMTEARESVEERAATAARPLVACRSGSALATAVADDHRFRADAGPALLWRSHER
jgi:hypothetical protein